MVKLKKAEEYEKASNWIAAEKVYLESILLSDEEISFYHRLLVSLLLWVRALRQTCMLVFHCPIKIGTFLAFCMFGSCFRMLAVDIISDFKQFLEKWRLLFLFAKKMYVLTTLKLFSRFLFCFCCCCLFFLLFFLLFCFLLLLVFCFCFFVLGSWFQPPALHQPCDSHRRIGVWQRSQKHSIAKQTRHAPRQ